MNVDEIFLKELYTNFIQKQKSIHKYTDRLNTEVDDLKESTIKLVNELQEKYKILMDFKTNKQQINPSSFATETFYDKESVQAADDSLQRKDRSIEQLKHSINYKIDKLNEDHKAIGVLLSGYIKTLNTIHDQWVDLIEKAE